VEGRNCKLKIENCKLKMIYLGAVFAAIRGRIMLRPCTALPYVGAFGTRPYTFLRLPEPYCVPCGLFTHYSLLTTHY
jgi:hypothetical protein